MIVTERLVVRPPEEGDRDRMVELFTDPTFTVFGDDHDRAGANERFDRMLSFAAVLPHAKQPILERSSGRIIGYTGAGPIEIDGLDRQEWGWRLDAAARGRGYATEAARALLDDAGTRCDGEMLALIHVDNLPSQRVADALGFRRWRTIDWGGDPDEATDLLVRPVGRGGAPLLAPPRTG